MVINNNQGYLEPLIYDPRRWISGGYSGIVGEPLEPDGQWKTPIYECQRNVYFDTMGCVTFATLNAIETIMMRRFGVEVNYSDRYIAKLSGTGRNGNWASNVVNEILRSGLVEEKVWAFDKFNFKTWEQYYADIPWDVIGTGKLWNNKYDFKHEWLPTTDDQVIMDALIYSPLTVAVHAWDAPVGGIYQRSTGRKNHYVLLTGFQETEYWKIFDHYDNCYKKLAWDFDFGEKMKFDITLKKPSMPTNLDVLKDNNTLVFCAEGAGEMGLYLDGKIIVDDLSKLMAQFIMRNDGEIAGKTKSVSLEVWRWYSKINLKKEPV